MSVECADVAVSNPPLGKVKKRKRKMKWNEIVKEQSHSTKFKVKCKNCGFRGPVGEQEKDKVKCPNCGFKKDLTISDIKD